MQLVCRLEARSESQTVVLKFFRSLGSSEALRALFASDATWTVWGASPLAGTYRGRDAVVEGFHANAAALFDPDYDGTMEITNLIGMGDVVAAELSYESRTAIGRNYHNHYCHVFEVSGGQIFHVREYMDTAHFQEVCFSE